jgi:hypothetical protein
VPLGGAAASPFPPAWQHPRPLPAYTLSPHAPDPLKFTLVLNTFKRPDQLRTSLRTYEHCASIDAIRVVWSEPGTPPDPSDPSAAPFFSPHVPVIYDRMPSTSFNNRFRPLEDLKTEAIFSVDDDIYMPCADLDRAFARWRERPRQLVGFYARAHEVYTRPVTEQAAEQGGVGKSEKEMEKGSGSGGGGGGSGGEGSLSSRLACHYRYIMKLPTIWLKGFYSIVLTKACFLHRDYLVLYTEHMPAAVRDKVDAGRNCEDIAMQFLASYITGEPPELVYSGRLRDVGQGNKALGQVRITIIRICTWKTFYLTFVSGLATSPALLCATAFRPPFFSFFPFLFYPHLCTGRRRVGGAGARGRAVGLSGLLHGRRLRGPRPPGVEADLGHAGRLLDPP